MSELLDGRYELRRRLDHHEPGTVWRAFDVDEQRDVIVRVLVATDPGQPEALRDELNRRAQVRSSHLVPCERVAVSGEVVYAVEPMVEGLSARARHTAQGPFSVSEAVAVGVCVLEAVEDMHRAGVVHGAIRSTGILGLTGDGAVDSDQVKLVSAAAGVAGEHPAEASPDDDVRAAAILVLDLLCDPEDDRGVGERLSSLRDRAPLLAGFLAGPLDPDAALPGGAKAMRTSLSLFARLDELEHDVDDGGPDQVPDLRDVVAAEDSRPPAIRWWTTAAGLITLTAIGFVTGFAFISSLIREESLVWPGLALSGVLVAAGLAFLYTGELVSTRMSALRALSSRRRSRRRRGAAVHDKATGGTLPFAGDDRPPQGDESPSIPEVPPSEVPPSEATPPEVTPSEVAASEPPQHIVAASATHDDRPSTGDGGEVITGPSAATAERARPPLVVVGATQTDDDLADALTVVSACLEEGGPVLAVLEDAAVTVRPVVARRLQRVISSLTAGSDVPDAVTELAGPQDDAAVGGLLDALQELPAPALPTALRLASQMVAERSAVHREEKTLRFEGWTAALALAATPVVVVLLRVLLIPELVPAMVQGLLRWLLIALACGLAALGTWWLATALRPPVSAGFTAPARQAANRLRERDRLAERLTDVMDKLALHMTSGVSLAAALQRISAVDDVGLQLARAVQRPSTAGPEIPSIIAGAAQTLAGAAGPDDAQEAARALGTRLRWERLQRLEAQAQRIPVVAAVPFAVCLLPATILLLIL